MKLKRNIIAAAMALSLVAGVALATTSNTDSTDTPRGPGYGMMNGQGPHHGFRGHGGHGKGWMGEGQDCGRRNGGPGMGQRGQMWRGAGMHHGAAMNPEMREKQNQFMDSTKDLRKELHDKQFAYMEAKRNPSLTQGELQKQEDALYTLRQELRSKRPKLFSSEQ